MPVQIDDFSLNSLSHDRLADSIYLQIKYALLCVRYIGKIRNNGKQCDLSNLVNSVFYDFDSILAPIQFKSEIIELLEILKNYEPINILEIGSANGGTLYLFSRVASKKARLLGIDVPFGRYPLSYSIIKRIFLGLFKLRFQMLKFVERDSHDPDTVKTIESYIDGNNFDFLFIDGDHSYEGVKKDFELYSPLIKDGGLICFHDIVHHPPGTVSHAAEVDVFWEEIKSNQGMIILKSLKVILRYGAV